MKKDEKRNKPTPSKFMSAFLAGVLFLFGAASCGQQEGGSSEGPNVLADEEHVRDLGHDRGFEGDENELVTNEEIDGFDRWDSNADQRWDTNEFESVANESQFYHNWDRDRDGLYSEDELNEGVFNTYDENSDGSLSSVEYENFRNSWNSENIPEFEEANANDDDFLTYGEFNKEIYNAGIYDDWNTEQDTEGETVPGDRVTDDSRIFGESEIHEGLFRSWDADEDGYLSSEEYQRFGRNLEN